MTTDKKVDKGGLFNSDMRMKIEIFFIFMLVTDLLFIPLQKSLINNKKQVSFQNWRID